MTRLSLHADAGEPRAALLGLHMALPDQLPADDTSEQSVVKPRVAPRSALRPLSKARRGNPCGCPVVRKTCRGNPCGCPVVRKTCRGNPCGCPVRQPELRRAAEFSGEQLNSAGSSRIQREAAEFSVKQQNSAGKRRIQQGAAGCNVDPQMSTRIGGFHRETAEFRGEAHNSVGKAEFRGEAQNSAGIECSGVFATGCQGGGTIQMNTAPLRRGRSRTPRRRRRI